MPPRRRSALVALVTLASFATGAAAQSGGTVALFDGTSLRGWRGDPAVWSVRDGCIMGSTVGRPIDANTYLIWDGGEPADFELAFAVRLEGDNNSGVQYRSRVLDGGGFAVAGYQCDVHGAAEYFGMLYEERGAGILVRHGQHVARDQDGGVRMLRSIAAPRPVDLGRWHAVRVVARGNLVWHEVDGRIVTLMRDDAQTAPRRGVLALQVHAGPPMTVWFRDLALRLLPTEEVAAPLPPALAALLARDRSGAGAPQWIWDRAPQDGEEVFFRRAFDLAGAPARAQLTVACDNHCRVYVNGERVVQSDDWTVPRSVDVHQWLRAGSNVVAVHAWNDAGPAGLLLRLSWSGGVSGEVVTDATWRCGPDDPDGWNRAPFDDAAWAPVRCIAELGAPEAPWTFAFDAAAFGETAAADAPQAAVAAPELQVQAGFAALRLLAVPRAFGSWVCLAADDRGRLYASDQTRGLYRVQPARALGEASTIERVDVDLDGCQGLCWFRSALYAVENGKRAGLCRLTDTDGDDRLDHVERLRAFDGSGEHGPHAVVPAPDGRNLLVLCGNHTRLPELAASRLPRSWAEDALLPKIEDPNGHAVGIRAPGGYVCLVDPDGERFELYCAGFRNAYDLAVLPGGDVVTYDADMEWDMGLPWYRPTRLLHVLSGVDYGWRSGTAKWPTDLPDTLPGILDLGPGSPTGVAVLGGDVLALDWTFGIVHRIALAEAGASLRGAAEPFASGTPLPVADAVADGDRVHLLTGGRGLRSTLYAIVRTADGERAAAAPPDASAAAARAQRRHLETFHGRIDATAVDVAFAQLGSGDAVLRHAARMALESQPIAAWRDRALAVDPAATWTALTALVAVARHGTADDFGPVVDALARIAFAGLDRGQRLAWLRAHELALLRLGGGGTARRAELAARLLPLLPSGDDRLDGMLAALLAHVDARGLLDAAVPLLQPLRPAEPPPWLSIAARNATYGGAIERMVAAMPPSGQIALANALRTVRSGWTLAQRRQFFAFIAAARARKGGASYDGYLKAFVDAAWAACSPAEQNELAELVGQARAPLPVRRVAQPKGPGRDWQLEEALALARTGIVGRDFARGRDLFHAAACAACHYFAGEGGNHGPDLTSLGNKFGAADVLEAILEPSRVVSDQYAGSTLVRRDGATLFGRVARVQHDGADVYEVMPAAAVPEVVRVPVADVQDVQPSRLSPMPADLVDRLAPDELLDLLAFLLSRGDARGPMFAR